MVSPGYDEGFDLGFEIEDDTGGGGDPTPPPPPTTPGTVGGDSGFAIIVRDRRTLAVLGELTEFVDLAYTRRNVDPGDFTLTIHRNSPPPATPGGPPDASLLDAGRLIEVRRRGVFEFAGITDNTRELDAVTGIWQLAGPDLLGYWLRRRGVGIEAEDAVSDVPAETALKHYVGANGGPDTVDPDRLFTADLGSATWAVEADSGRGANVNFTALRRNLLADVVVPIAKAGDVLHEVALTAAGYEYRVSLPTPASSVPFSLSWVNVSAMKYRENLADQRNAVYVLGPGTGDARTVQEVVDPARVAAEGRYELFLDARDATVGDAQTQLGLLEIATRAAGREGADAQPHLANSVYRVDYDLGQDVTLSIPEAGVDGITKRITAIKVSVGKEERIEVELGAPARTLAGIIADAVRKSLRASFA